MGETAPVALRVGDHPGIGEVRRLGSRWGGRKVCGEYRWGGEGVGGE